MPTDMNSWIRMMAAQAPPSDTQSTTNPEPDPRSRDIQTPRSISSQSPHEGEWVDLTPRPPEETHYTDPRDIALREQYPYDELPKETGNVGPEIDPRFIGEVNRNPDGAEAGPMYLSPEAKLWMREIIDAGFSVDWGTKTYFNVDTGEEYPIPTSFPKMM